ncbi:MAG: DoxX family protein [Bacteroidetes bacterium]|nr:DoxX family protein [Bacteroidota bacterium]
MKFIIQLFRIAVGLLFIFSGLIKANDPLGFSYKLDEYFEVFGTEWMKPLSLSISIFMCALEMLLGFMLLIGSRIKLTLWLLLLMILFFASLNFYSGYYDKVRECGCFGDFIVMTPWQEFRNNIIMLVMTIFMMIKSSYIRPLFGKIIENILMVIAIIKCIGFPLYTYNYLPIKDFRPYAIGKNILEGMKLPENAKTDSIVMTFIYEKAGKQIELTQDQIKTIDSTYKFVDRKDKVVREGDKPAIHDFSITSVDGNDYTEQILNYPGYCFFLVCYDLEKTDKTVFGKVNDFTKLCKQDSVPIICLTASSEQIESFKKATGSTIDFYLTDGTQLKTMIRANPGLMLLKKGTVMDMWHYHSFPSYSDVKTKYFKK